jgi:hypothetical protein
MVDKLQIPFRALRSVQRAARRREFLSLEQWRPGSSRINPDHPVLALLFLAGLLAFAISAIAGGGASLLLVPLLGQVLAVASIPAALSIGTGASSVARIATFRKDIRWKIAAWFVPAAVPGLGEWLNRRDDEAIVASLVSRRAEVLRTAISKLRCAPRCGVSPASALSTGRLKAS